MNFVTNKHFDKSVAKLPKAVKLTLRQKLEIFVNDPFDDRLRNHGLKGSLRNYRSVNITGDYRLIYEEYDENTIRLIDIGTHSQICVI